MPKDLRSWLKQLEENNLIYKIKKEADPKTQMGTLCSESEKALLFENVKGYPGWKVCADIIQSREQHALLLGTPKDKVVPELAKRFAEGPKECKMVSSGPVKDKIVVGDEVDLTKLPVITHSTTCGGPYIGAGTCITKDPDTGIRNLACLRMQVLSKNHTGCQMSPMHSLMNYQKYEKEDKPMPMAVAIGMHPAYEVVTSYSTEYPCDELGFVEPITGEPVELVKCETIDMEVPASAEIVLEGEIPPKVRVEEGPFAEYTGYSREVLGKNMLPMFKVKAITMRKDAIYRHIQTIRFTDHQALCALPLEAHMYTRTKSIGGFADIRDIYVPPWGGLYVTIIQMVPRFDTEARSVILGALSTSYHYPKVIIVVDEDVNIYDARDVIWSIGTRVDPAKDVIVIPGAGVSENLDIEQPVLAEAPAGAHYRVGNRIGIDATKPSTLRKEQRDMFERAVPMGEGKFFLKDFL
ncbi:MAG: UbiD family decarboxylase [Methanobacteriota archaeon]